MIVFRAQDVRFKLDHHAGQLWREQERVHLPPKQWDVLCYLAENPSKLVTKDELHQRVWGDVNVGPSAIDRVVSDVRRALRDQADDPHFIETVNRRGYRFVARIESVEGGSSSFPGTEKVDIFRVEALDRWPYESAISYGTAAPSGQLPLETDLISGTRYRCYSLRPDQFVTWGLVGQNFLDGENFRDAIGNPLSSADVARPQDLWIQVEYVLFRSTSRSDDARIDRFRRIIAAGGISATEPLGKEAPDRLTVGNFNDPWYQWYEQGERTNAAECRLFVSAITNLEHVNAHSIPGQQDYENIQVSIFDYRPYHQVPALIEVFERFDRYNHWFADLSR